jgi:hypothetical protein
LDRSKKSVMLGGHHSTIQETDMAPTLRQELDQLHDEYVVAVNQAIADGALDRAEQLAASYDADAVELVADREGLTHLLPIEQPVRHESALRRIVRRATSAPAA